MGDTSGNSARDTFLNAAEAASLLRQVAAALRRAGKTADADRFETTAASLDATMTSEATTARLEQYKSQLAKWESELKYHLDWRIESFRGTLALGQRAITAAMLINGGAAVTLLAYMGNTRETAPAFSAPLLWFALGVMLAATTFALSYATQFYYTEHAANADDDVLAASKKKIGIRCHLAAVAFLILSYLAFGVGAMTSTSAFIRPESTAPITAAKEERNMPPPKPPGQAPVYAPAKPANMPVAPQKPALPTE